MRRRSSTVQGTQAGLNIISCTTLASCYITLASYYMSITSYYMSITSWYMSITSWYMSITSWYMSITSWYMSQTSWYKFTRPIVKVFTTKGIHFTFLCWTTEKHRNIYSHDRFPSTERKLFIGVHLMNLVK